MKTFLPATAVVLGILLLVGSVAWAILFPASRSWTQEKSKQLTELGNQATAIQLQIDRSKTRPSMHSGENPAELQEKYEQVAAEYKTLYAEFKGADAAPKTASVFLRWS